MKEDIELRDYLAILNRRKRFIIGGTLACLALAALISLLLPRIYQASLIIQVGKIYLPPQREGGRQEVEFLEEPEAAGEVIASEAVLDRVRDRLGLDVTLVDLKDELSVSTFMENVSPTKLGNPLVTITCQDRSPQTAVDILNLLAEIIIEEQNRKYFDNLQAYQERITNLNQSITEMDAVIENQQKMRTELQAQIIAAAEKTREYDQKLAALDTSRILPVEVLFIGSYSSNQDRTVSMFSESIVTIDYNIAANLEKIGEFRDQIAVLKNLISLCNKTEVRSKAVLPRKSIKPRIGFNIAIGSFIGLVLTVVIAFSGEGDRK
ncbi:MAG: Wzz/FepE/Etk N-terminal domain-containing protein [PVC group bacterium]